MYTLPHQHPCLGCKMCELAMPGLPVKLQPLVQQYPPQTSMGSHSYPCRLDFAVQSCVAMPNLLSSVLAQNVLCCVLQYVLLT